MKRIVFSILISLVLVLGLVSCGDEASSSSASIASSEISSSQSSSASESETISDSSSAEVASSSVPASSMPDSSSVASSSASSESIAELQNTNITVDTNEEFSAILTAPSAHDESIKKFVRKYSYSTIEFDGCITYITNHGDYNTRYDLLLSPGDYVDENTQNPGPNFKFEDVGVRDLGIDDLYLPDFVNIGNNVHVVAKVLEFNQDAGILELDPISVEAR